MTDNRHVLAIYPGSFDPITLGHEDVARRTLQICDRLIVAVAHTATQSKQSLFSVTERLEILAKVFSDEPRIEVAEFQGLLVDFAKQRDAQMVVRGLRAISDFEYELQMAQMNRNLWREFETVFLTPDEHYSYLSASLVREVAALGGDVSAFLSPSVLTRVLAKVSV